MVEGLQNTATNLGAAIAVLALIALSALFFTRSMPTRAPGRSPA